MSSSKRLRSAVSHALLIFIPAVYTGIENTPSPSDDEVVNLGPEAFIGSVSQSQLTHSVDSRSFWTASLR